MFSAEITGLIFTKILHDVAALVGLFNHAYTRRYPILFLNARAISARGGVVNFATKLVTMATSLKISKKDVQTDHLHPKCFHLVKRLRKSVKRILR